MIQTTIFNYFNCNNKNDSIKYTENKIKSFKQTSLKDYYKIIPKKKSILDYFKPKDKDDKEKEGFDLILVDIKNTRYSEIKCVKKNIYDSDLKYLAISYRWGELDEQQVQTPDYIAHITSFHLWDLVRLCLNISKEQDLKEIRYLWIDAISVDQHIQSRKKEAILKMNHIYKMATYILAIPDLHQFYLRKNLLNNEIMNLIWEKQDLILKHIFNHDSSLSSTDDNKNNNKNKQEKMDYYNVDDEDDDIKKVYQFLAYLIEDWSNRVWVISEYQIAKEKYEKHGTPLKYMFMSLLSALPPLNNNIQFFSHYFDQQHQCTTNNNNNNKLSYTNVINSSKLINFLNTRFIYKSYIDMILNSNASKNEDRFNAILPLWKKVHHHLMTEWNITDMISVRLKLYEIMDDLWDKATLLYACSGFALQTVVILPSFASHYDGKFLEIIEKENIPLAFENYKTSASSSSSSPSYDLYNENYKVKFNGSSSITSSSSSLIYTENLTSIQFNHYYLSVKSNIYFIYEVKDIWLDEIILSYSSLDGYDCDCLYYVFIPFFTFTIPDYLQVPPPMTGSNICLLGNIDTNRWVLFNYESFKNKFNSYHFCSDHYTFNIY